MKFKYLFILTFVLLLPLNNIEAKGLDKKAQLRSKAMERAMGKLMAPRERAMEEAMGPGLSKIIAGRDKAIDLAMRKLAQEKVKERFFFTQNPSLVFLGLRRNPIIHL